MVSVCFSFFFSFQTDKTEKYIQEQRNMQGSVHFFSPFPFVLDAPSRGQVRRKNEEWKKEKDREKKRKENGEWWICTAA